MGVERLANELIAHIIDHLFDDFPSLLTCSLVCQSWRDWSRYHIFARGVVRIHEKGSRSKRGFTKFLHLLENSKTAFSPSTLEIQFDKEPRQLMPVTTFQGLRAYTGQCFAAVTTLRLRRFAISSKAEDARHVLAQLAGVLNSMNDVVDLSMDWMLRNSSSSSGFQRIIGRKTRELVDPASGVQINCLLPKMKRLSLHGEGSGEIAAFLSSIDAVARVERLGIKYQRIDYMDCLLDIVGSSLVELQITGVTDEALPLWKAPLVPRLNVLIIGVQPETTFSVACDLVVKFVSLHGTDWPLRQLVLQAGYDWTDGPRKALQLLEKVDESVHKVQSFRQVDLHVLKYRDEVRHWAKSADIGTLLPRCQQRGVELKLVIGTRVRAVSMADLGLMDTSEYLRRMKEADLEDAEDAALQHH
ncbi:hypothetical protein C8J56DRAFT_1078043 [Mycena floridula]|nr:hypothetical protein C8J56DRAFT_1078043 [Mycena floridula]